MSHTGFVKRKVSNAGKMLVPKFYEKKQQFLVDIAAVVIIDEILHDLVINSNRTGSKMILTLLPEITAVLAATISCKYTCTCPLYKGTTRDVILLFSFLIDRIIWHLVKGKFLVSFVCEQ